MPVLYLFSANELKSSFFAPEWDELIKYVTSYSIGLDELNATTCNGHNKDISFRASVSQIIIGKLYTWDEYRTVDNLRCIKLLEPRIGFLDDAETKAFLTAESGHKNKNIDWKQWFFLKYYYYRDPVCDSVRTYKPSKRKGFIISENICGKQTYVAGSFVLNIPVFK